MVREAEQFAEQDKKAKEEAETHNTADSLIYTTEKTLSEVGDKLSSELKSRIQGSLDELKKAAKEGTIDDVKAKTEALTKVVQEAGAEIYKQTQAQQAQQQASQQAPPPQGGDQEQGKKTVDAEYKVVDEEEKK
jgi:molecular chaperone DnaK